MPDDRIPISEFDEAPQLDNNDVIPVLHPINNVLTTVKTKLTALGTHLLKVMQFASDLNTDNKTIIGAINELEAGGGGGGSSTLAGLTDVTITNPSNSQVITYNAQTGKWVNGAGAEITLTNTFSATPIATFTDGAENVPMKSLVVNIEPQQASGTPTPSSPLPISGFTGANITHTGKNLWSGTASPTGTYRSSVIDFFLPAGDYVFSSTVTSSDTDGTKSLILLRDIDNGAEYVRLDRNTRSSFAITFTKDIVSIQFYAGYNDVQSAGDTYTFADLQIEKDTSTATTYEPYTATTYPITWQTEAGTVYGGWYDVTTGKLTIVLYYESYSSCELYGNYGSDNKPLYYVESSTPNIKPRATSQQSGHLTCNYFNETTGTATITLGNNEIRTQDNASSNRTYFRADDYTLAQLNTMFGTTPLQVCYELATPIEYNLTPTTIKTQGGTESIFADCGDVEGEYFNLIANDVASLVNLILDGKQTILTDTLEAGETEITFTSDKITTDSMIDVYTSPVGINYSAIAVSTGEVVITFAEQASDIGVKAVIK